MLTRGITDDVRDGDILRHLCGAVATGQMYVEYQPQFKISGKLAGFEALVRWHNFALGRVAPSEFIPVAERTGNVIEIDNFVRDETVRRIHDNSSLLVSGGVHISLNLSPKMLQNHGFGFFSDRVLTQMRNLGIPGELLVVEITETSMIDISHEVERQMAALQSYGVRIAIDDFGTGFASLDYAREMQIDYIKIDKTFIDRIETDRRTAIIVGSIIRMAHALEASVVAEGIETMEQFVILKDLSCDIIQGYLLGRPMSWRDAVALTRKERS